MQVTSLIEGGEAKSLKRDKEQALGCSSGLIQQEMFDYEVSKGKDPKGAQVYRC